GDANKVTTELVNAAVASNQPIDQMLMAMIQLGPAFRDMGYDAAQSATLLGELTKSGEPLARLSFAFNDAVVAFRKHGLTDVQQAWRDLITMVRDDIAKGNETAAGELLRSYEVTPRAANVLIDAIRRGLPVLPEELTQQKPLGNLDRNVEEIIEKTRGLKDAWMQISNILEGVLAPIGIGLETGLVSMTDHIRDWLEENKQQIVGWAGEIGHWVLTGIGDLAGAVSTTIKALEPIMNALFKVVLTFATGVAALVHQILQVATHLPFVGHDFV